MKHSINSSSNNNDYSNNMHCTHIINTRLYKITQAELQTVFNE